VDNIVADYLSELDFGKLQQFKNKEYKSVGQGWDHRFVGKRIVGSAPLYRKRVIHAAFFRVTETSKAGRITGCGRRRDFRL